MNMKDHKMTTREKLSMNLTFYSFLIFLMISALNAGDSMSILTVADVFGDNMVLQRNSEISIWGTGEPGTEVQISFKKQSIKTIVNADGKWKTILKPETAGGPFELTITDRKEKIKYSDILLGEVWLCSGQSNMEMPVKGDWATLNNADEEVKNANYPDIRLFTVERNASVVPVENIQTSVWHKCSPQSIAGFSATAYFFGRELYKNLNVPIGLVHSSWGGTIAEAWTSGNSLKKIDGFADAVDQIEKAPGNTKALWEQYYNHKKEWLKLCEQLDPGIVNGDTIASQPDYDDSKWKTMNLPTFWEDTEVGGIDGAVWFRKTIEIPASWKDTDLTLRIGPCDDHDITWFNGVKLGEEHVWDKPRVYNVPADIIKTGKNNITVRVVDDQGGGGIWGEEKDFGLDHPDGQTIDLTGSWRYLVSYNKNELPVEPRNPEDPNRVTVLYNGMIHPLIPFAIKGAIWYQGESNASQAFQYRTIFKNMIKNWRSLWQYDFPFYFVQLANYMERNTDPIDDTWAELRESQMKALELPETGMAVAIDIGDADDIHPHNKQDVGKRLALWALGNTYDKEIPFSGPLFQKFEKVDHSIKIDFTNVYKGLKTSDNRAVIGFAIAGKDKKFYWAKAVIQGKSVVVSSELVPDPEAVRYGWSANPDVNLVNSAGLPASPFRTDNWKGITEL